MGTSPASAGDFCRLFAPGETNLHRKHFSTHPSSVVLLPCEWRRPGGSSSVGLPTSRSVGATCPLLGRLVRGSRHESQHRGLPDMNAHEQIAARLRALEARVAKL